MKPVFVAAVAIAGLPPLSASAHVAVAPAVAPPGATETFDFIVGHGCAGQPTTALRVEFPATVSSVEPQPKAGWTPTVDLLPAGGRAVTWRGGEPLAKAEGFAVRLRLPSHGAAVAFTAVQSCGGVTVRWDEPTPADGPRPTHPAPTVKLSAAPPAVTAGDERLPAGVQRLADGGLADSAGKPLYTFDFDTMVGMSHCEDDCAQMWPPLIAPKDARPFGAWTVIPRSGGIGQWALRDKPLYTYSKDRPGQPAAGTEAPKWKRAK